MHEPILKTEQLSKIYGKGHTEVRAVDQVSLSVYPGELVIIMGPSGSGKTTLLSMLGGLLKPSGGIITVDGIEITAVPDAQLPDIRAHKLGFIFQSFNLLDALTVQENILFPAQLNRDQKQDARHYADALIQQLGLSHRRHAMPGTLSGGEKQRVAIARALINRPRIILADEPTGNLDSKSGQDVTMILHDIARDRGCAVVMVTHDPRVEEVADRILWLEDGKLRDRKSEIHAWVRDPVCGMMVDKWTADIVYDYKDMHYYFCSDRCKERFMAEPQEYLT